MADDTTTAARAAESSEQHHGPDTSLVGLIRAKKAKLQEELANISATMRQAGASDENLTKEKARLERNLVLLDALLKDAVLKAAEVVPNNDAVAKREKEQEAENKEGDAHDRREFVPQVGLLRELNEREAITMIEAKRVVDAHKCAFCEKLKVDNGGILLRCARCRLVQYCGRECQTKDWPAHKESCTAQNFMLKVELLPYDPTEESYESDRCISNPSVSCNLSCPANATFAQLHKALQIAFGWSGAHTYDFKIKDPDTEPPLWKKLTPEENINHKKAQRISQEKFGNAIAFQGPKQNLLRIVQNVTGVPMHIATDGMYSYRRKHSQTPEANASDVTLNKVFGNKKYAKSKIEYEYDFGDYWIHFITVVGRAPSSEKFFCTGGEGHGVAEDVGSNYGWAELKEAYRTQNPSEDQRSMRHWFENDASNKDPKGLGNGRDKFWDKEVVNRNLQDEENYSFARPARIPLGSGSWVVQDKSMALRKFNGN